MKPLYRERSTQLTSRGRILLGIRTNLTTLASFSLWTLYQHTHLLRYYYGLEACDLLENPLEPSPHTVPLVQHCSQIGLAPTLVTSRIDATALDLEAAGLEDWLLSLHGGSPASHDAILGDAGSFERIVRGLDLVQRPVRFSLQLTEANYMTLPVRLLLSRPPTVFELCLPDPWLIGHENVTASVFSIRYRAMAPMLATAIEELEGAGWEVNVRHWPLCIAEEFDFAENVCNYHQSSFDPWSYRINVSASVPLSQIEQEGGWHESERARAILMMQPRGNEVCASCRYRTICDKVPEQYQENFGLEKELHPSEGMVEYDPLVFQKKRAVQQR